MAKRVLLPFAAVVGFLALLGSVTAQVNFVPQIGVSTANLRAQTYAAISVGLVPAASATDLFCIAASSSKDIAVRRIEVSGIATTAITTPLVLLRRGTLDTGGTTATGIALPVAASMHSINVTSTATLNAYTTNPTVTDSTPSYLRTNAINLSPAATVTASDVIYWYGGTYNDAYDQGFDLIKGSTQQLCLNLNGATVTGGSLAINIEWTEQ